jgi:hypothetical protein
MATYRKKPGTNLSAKSWAQKDRMGLTPRSGASRSTSGKVLLGAQKKISSGAARSTSGKVLLGVQKKASSGAARSAAGKVGKLGVLRRKTSAQISAAKRNLEKARAAIKRAVKNTVAKAKDFRKRKQDRR